MPFQSKVNRLQTPGLPGDFASANPYQSVVAGQGSLVSAGDATVGSFCWLNTSGLATSTNPNASNGVAPRGFLGREGQALITDWLGEASLVVPEGIGVTLYDRGDFFVKNLFLATSYGKKVFVNKYGQVAPGDAGSFLTLDIGSSATISSGHIDNGTTLGTTGNVLTVVTGSGLQVGMLIEDSVTNAVIGTIAALGTGTGGAGTYFLNTNAAYPAASAFTIVGYSATGWTGTASFATDVMTVVSTVTGALAVGMVVESAGVAAGTYITVDNGDGTYVLSTSPGTITTQDASASGWVETPFAFKSAVNPGDTAVIGILN